MIKLTTEEFIKRAKRRHGDRYDYSQTKYVNAKTDVCIICKEHGKFLQRPYNHLNGARCPLCGKEARKAKRIQPVEEFLTLANAIHGKKYDYSKINYVNRRTKVCIVCPSHGDFWQTPSKHLAGQGCTKCIRESLAKSYSLGKETFTEKANLIFHGFYDYSEVDYVNSQTPVKIKCPIHGAFLQKPHDHLRGKGCPICAINKRTEKRKKWTYETCKKEASKYKTKNEFLKNNRAAYHYAQCKGFLKEFNWFEENKKPNGYWTRERCEKESRKYNSKNEFLKGSPGAHSAAVAGKWLDDFVWLNNKRININKDKIDSVYAYIFEEKKVAYVGRTLIRRQILRDKEHIFNIENDSVARYAKENQIPVPKMQILETDLTLEQGLDREDYWRKWFETQGYTMLNRLATGVGKGSLGAISHGKWNRKTCFEEAQKYNSINEFEKANGSAYDAARRNGWIIDYTWFVKYWEPKWDKNTCYEEAKKYKTRGEFQKKCKGGYRKAWQMGWLIEYDWMPSRQQKPTGYWDNYDHCFEEAKKYKSRRSFQKGCGGAYTKALKNGWLDNYTWFAKKKKQNYWNKETCMEEAKKYHNISAFKKHAQGAYQLAKKNGWIEEYTWFDVLTGFWTYEACKVEARKYEKRSYFKSKSPGAYSKSRINGWLDEFFPKNK